MVRPREVLYPALYGIIRVARSFGAKLEDAPIFRMARGYEGNEAREGVAIGPGWICDCGTRGYDDCIGLVPIEELKQAA